MSSHNIAATTQPSSREWGPAAEGVALKIFDKIYLCFKIINNYARFTKIHHCILLLLFKTLGYTNCFGRKYSFSGSPGLPFFWSIARQDILYWSHFLLIPNYQNFILCFVIDIGTIFAKNHSCYHVDIGPMSKIFQDFIKRLFGICRPRLFQKIGNLGFHNFEICKSQKWFGMFLVFFDVFLW